ncbi:hypothetical protein [Natrinema pallidum]|uniref:Uncharacterized protein n=1 Tax=Natrinema pallidum TaxID=69527 RepID=A0A4P9TEN5_9EURY|nr:hypothetical protein [Natrinema pallidum]QCW03251.1 hypothetical protein FGF80_08385 [Natrinema pallidum]
MTDGGRRWPPLTALQRDCLEGIACLERGERRGDGRVEYTPTDAGRALLRARIERLADACGLILVDRTDGTPTRETDG